MSETESKDWLCHSPPRNRLQVINLLIALAGICFLGNGLARESSCRMNIQSINETNSSVVAALFDETDKKIAVMPVEGRSGAVFEGLCKSRYKVVFKAGNIYTETDWIEISYEITKIGNSTQTSWKNGTARYFSVNGKVGGRPAAEKYQF